MASILKIFIDYSLFEKYDKSYFIQNKIVLIYEDNFSLKIAICKNSNLELIKDKTSKLLSFLEVEELEILFVLNNLDRKIHLYSLAIKSISQETSEQNMELFLYEILKFSIYSRSSDIHIEKFKEVVLF